MSQTSLVGASTVKWSVGHPMSGTSVWTKPHSLPKSRSENPKYVRFIGTVPRIALSVVDRWRSGFEAANYVRFIGKTARLES